jgi:hypothetical protein
VDAFSFLVPHGVLHTLWGASAALSMDVMESTWPKWLRSDLQRQRIPDEFLQNHRYISEQVCTDALSDCEILVPWLSALGKILNLQMIFDEVSEHWQSRLLYSTPG